MARGTLQLITSLASAFALGAFRNPDPDTHQSTNLPVPCSIDLPMVGEQRCRPVPEVARTLLEQADNAAAEVLISSMRQRPVKRFKARYTMFSSSPVMVFAHPATPVSNLRYHRYET